MVFIDFDFENGEADFRSSGSTSGLFDFIDFGSEYSVFGSEDVDLGFSSNVFDLWSPEDFFGSLEALTLDSTGVFGLCSIEFFLDSLEDLEMSALFGTWSLEGLGITTLDSIGSIFGFILVGSATVSTDNPLVSSA